VQSVRDVVATTVAQVAAAQAAVEAAPDLATVAATRKDTTGKKKKGSTAAAPQLPPAAIDKLADAGVRALAVLDRTATLHRHAVAARDPRVVVPSGLSALEWLVRDGGSSLPADATADAAARLQGLLWAAVQDSVAATAAFCEAWQVDDAAKTVTIPVTAADNGAGAAVGAAADDAAAAGEASSGSKMADKRLRSYYMDQLTRGFGEELDRLRREDGFDAHRLALLVDSLEHGVNIFAKLEGPLLAAAMDQSDVAADGRPVHRTLAP